MSSDSDSSPKRSKKKYAFNPKLPKAIRRWFEQTEVWAGVVVPYLNYLDLIRLQHVSRAALSVVVFALNGSKGTSKAAVDAIAAEKCRRAKSREQDRAQRRRHRFYMSRNPPIVRAALAGDMAAVKAELDAGVHVDTCGEWTETEYKSYYTKSWDWKNDTALSMACSIGHLPLIQLLLDRGANPMHMVCNVEDVHYTPAKIVRQHGHVVCADYMDDVLRAKGQQQRRAISVQLRAYACLLREAGPPYSHEDGIDSDIAKLVEFTGSDFHRTFHYFRKAAWDFKNGLGSEGFGSSTIPSNEEVSLDESTAFALLALAVLKTKTRQDEKLPNTEGMLILLRAVPEQAEEYAAAQEELAWWDKAEQEAAEKKRLKEERRAVEYRRRKEHRENQLKAYAQWRSAEVERCKHVWGTTRTRKWIGGEYTEVDVIKKGWQGACTDRYCITSEQHDMCTYGHSFHDLPPHCQFGSSCRAGDNCKFNHLDLSTRPFVPSI